MSRLIILPSAARFLKKIKEKPLKVVFQNAIDKIISDPYVGKAKTGDLSGIFCYDIFNNKINYELAYTIIENNSTTIVIILDGTRENFYDQLKRYMESIK
jgi:mRNA interferase RelE/StbE